MIATPRRLTAALAMSLVLGSASANAQVTSADYDRAIGLRERWINLTQNVADPATWVPSTSRFYYRKTIRGGFEWVLVDADTQQKRPAFDHAKLAAGLSKATGNEYTAQRLPFNSFQFVDGEQAIQLNMPGQGGVGPGGSWLCRLTDYSCTPSTGGGGRGGRGGGGGRGGQPRSFGAVRDLTVPADNRPRRLPPQPGAAAQCAQRSVPQPAVALAAGVAVGQPDGRVRVQPARPPGVPGDRS